MTKWKVKRTLLLVGEGRHEEAFLNHVKRLYVPRGSGLAVTIKNARGKGAKHVIEWTGKQIANVAYDKVAAMLDTDTDWTPAVEKPARTKRIQVLASNPCFDAVMLRLLGQPAADDAKNLKRRLAAFLCGDPTDPTNYVEHFGKNCLEAGRANEATIDVLLKLPGP